VIALTAVTNACPRCGGALIREPAGHQGAIGELERCCLICGWRGYQRPPDTTSPASANRSAALFRIREERSVSWTDEVMARREHLHRAIMECAEDGLSAAETGVVVGLTARAVRYHLAGECQCPKVTAA